MLNALGILNGAHDLIFDHCNLIDNSVDNSIVVNETIGLGPGSGIQRLLRQSMPECKKAISAHQRQQEKEKTAWVGLDSLGLSRNVDLTQK